MLINFSANPINAQLFRLDPGRAIFSGLTPRRRSQQMEELCPWGHMDSSLQRQPPWSTEWEAGVSGGPCGQQTLGDGEMSGEDVEVMGEGESGRSRYLVSWKGQSLLPCAFLPLYL